METDHHWHYFAYSSRIWIFKKLEFNSFVSMYSMECRDMGFSIPTICSSGIHAEIRSGSPWNHSITTVDDAFTCNTECA